jgi:hypothetical protein
MASTSDPLDRLDASPDRVAYATGALLGVDDFRAEQTYHRGRLARALAYLHDSGTVAGLRVAVDEGGADGAEPRVTVSPGLALDRLGRLVEVPRTACIRLDRWLAAVPRARRAAAYRPSTGGPLPPDDRPASDGYLIADVWVRFRACPWAKTPAFASGPFDALDAIAPSRLRDAYQLSLLLREEDEPLLPGAPWPDLPPDATAAERLRLLQQAMLEAGWREGTAGRAGQVPEPLREHALTQDTTDIFLARLVLPARRATDPVRYTAQPVAIDNHSRRFVYPTAALAHWLAG